MHLQNARHMNVFRGIGTAQTRAPFRPEMPMPTEWDQLLAKLALNDSQALEAVKSSGELGEQLRNFVFRFFTQCFVPEEVIKAASGRRGERRHAGSSASQPVAIDSNAVATSSGEPV